ncbi:hypothetical protein CASFOL_040001 [Castilleja foliolosa]
MELREARQRHFPAAAKGINGAADQFRGYSSVFGAAGGVSRGCLGVFESFSGLD